MVTKVPIFVISGYSGSGKTTLVERLVAWFSARGLRVATAKHHRGEVEVDKPGKDSWRHRRAGSVATFLVAGNGLTAFYPPAPDLTPAELVPLCPEGTDLLLVEGFKTLRGYPRLHLPKPGEVPEGEDLVALAGEGVTPPQGVPVYSRDDVDALGRLIARAALERDLA